MGLPTQTNYDIAFSMALDALARSDLSQRCRRAGALFDPKTKIVDLCYLNGRCLIQMPEGRFCWGTGSERVPVPDRILILHYLSRATGNPLCGRLISFAEVPGGREYLPAFRRRSVDIVLSAFGDRPEALLGAASRLGGTRANYGDVSATVNALPRVPITFVLWRGDGEVDGSANILFDATVTECLPTEDIAVLAGIVSVRLLKGPTNTTRLS